MIRFHGMRIGAYEVRVALLLSAGFWQLRRAEEKRTIALEQADRGGKQTVVLEPALAASTSLEQLRHRRARAAGHYRGDVQYLLDNRIQNRAAGYHVLTPFRLQGSDVHLLVNRGWLPVGPDRGRLPAVTVSDKAVVQEGLIVAPPASGLALGASGYDGEG